jgi:hypothetical protein
MVSDDVLFGEGSLEVSFGTGGMLPRFFSRNLACFKMEKPMLPAKTILSKQYARNFYRSVSRFWRQPGDC